MAEKRKITKKVISSKLPKKEETVSVVRAEPAVEETTKEARSKKVCSFCQTQASPSYTDLAALRKFMTDRAKIVPKLRSGVCARHQRAVAKNIKYARHLALLPFVPKV